MLNNYSKYLDFITKKIDKFFEEQKPYIFCKKGCAKCCKNAQFPFSHLEAAYLTNGINTLTPQQQDIIGKKIAQINNDKKNFEGELFLYDCPFLIDDVCCVYDYRGLLCRTFGLIASNNDNKAKIPFCYTEGLNYSNVVDYDKNVISQEKCTQLGYEKEPVGYNISYDFLTGEGMEKAFNIKFGEKKPLIEWFDGIE